MSRMPSILSEAPPEITEVAANVGDAPQLLVQWSSPWEEFRTAIRPALQRSPKRLAGEAPVGMFPAKGMVAGWILEALLLVAAVILPGKLTGIQPYTPLPKPKYDVIYFSGEELPQTRDAGGAQTGKSGRAGGHEGLHRTQTIKVARGDSPTEKVVDAPKLNLPKSDQPVANLLAIKTVPGPPPASGLRSSLPALPAINPIAPPPQISREKLNPALTLNSGVIAPAPQITRDKMQSVPALTTQVVAPPPSVQRDSSGVRLPQVGTEIVPPPVSAPVSTTSMAARLNLPQPGVVAPPPSNVAHDVPSLPSGAGADFSQSIVPPPVDVNGQLSNRQQVGSLAGNSKVVPPPVQVNGQLSNRQQEGSLTGTDDVVPPPVQVAGGVPGNRGTGTISLANGVVPPPPSVTGGTSSTGRGRGNAGAGLGGPLDGGLVAAPPKNAGGNGDKAGVVISNQPGSQVGVPGKGGAGSMAMSPTGSKPGVGGSGGGNGIGRGTGTGSGLEGTGSGAGKTGTGRGSELAAKGGISPYPGAGGAGTGRAGLSPAPGIAVSGGNTITLPSFGADGNANVPGRSGTLAGKHGPGITIEATPRSGGAFNLYGALKGDKVYTIYIETTLGTAVLQYADPSSAAHSYRQELSAPEPMRADVPAGLSHSRVVIACVLDRAGILRNLHILEPGSPDMDARILAALPSWKFRPAQRGDQPVEVNAILGFNIDTR
jgi:hypothetical protein